MFLRVNRKKEHIFTSCGGLRVLAAQELLAPLLAHVLFLGCTVTIYYLSIIIFSIILVTYSVWQDNK